MDNTHVATGFYFELTYKQEKIAFQEASGLSEELNPEDIEAGGENRFKFKLPTIATTQNLILKRALISADSNLLAWCKNTVDSGFATSIGTNDISISLVNAEQEIQMTWTFHNAYPVKYAIANLRSQENEFVIESIEFAYTYFQKTGKK
jgi:phage tail-like protein